MNQKDKGKGPVSTVLINNGRLKRGDHLYVRGVWKIVMIDHNGKTINEALPMPVEILGMNGTAYAGAEFIVTKDEDEFRKMIELKIDKSNNNPLAKDKTTLFDNVKGKDELNIVIKSDVQGSSEFKNGYK